LAEEIPARADAVQGKDTPMAIVDSLLPEFDHEMATTRKLLDRVPADNFTWKPHPKSMSLGQLAAHLAGLPGWVAGIINEDSYDIKGDSGNPPEGRSQSDILEMFDKNVAAARKAIASKTDAEFMAPWTLKRNGQDLFTIPKVSVVRSFLLNHLIHHRGQFSVYLRLNDVPLPPIYGPTADERG
jgi:uncharacterized damage-inducible protein DinB